VERAADAGKVVEGADVDIGASVDGPGTKGDAQDLGQTPGMVAKYIPQVANDGKLGIVLANVFVDEGGRRRRYSTYAKTHTVKLGQGLEGRRFVVDHSCQLKAKSHSKSERD